MKQKLFTIFALMVLIIPSVVMAAGTPAGTTITNTATARYNVSGADYEETSNSVSTIVAELLDAEIVWQGTGTGQTVSPGDTSEALVFTITNTGNGEDTYDLSANSTIGGGTFTAIFRGIYYDTNGNGSYDVGIDQPYEDSNPLTLDGRDPANNSMTMLVLNDIPTESNPDVRLVDGDIANCAFTITSRSISGTPPGDVSAGYVLPGAGENSTDAIIGNFAGQFDITSSYIVLTVAVTITKSALVTDDFGRNEPVPGSTITYTIVVEVEGGGIAENVIITDSIPVNTTYTPGSMTLDTGTGATSLLDTDSDGDTGHFTISSPDNYITVGLGDLNAASPDQTITFEVTID